LTELSREDLLKIIQTVNFAKDHAELTPAQQDLDQALRDEVARRADEEEAKKRSHTRGWK
jgi:hypothetical protein